MGGSGTEFSVAAIWRKGAFGKLLRLASPLIDSALGLRRLQQVYERDGLRGLDRFAFIDRMIEKEGFRYSIDEAELSRIPREGPVVVVANHPLGGLEGIILMRLLRSVRADYKVFANVIDSFIEELKDFFIFTNPMAKGSAANYESIRLSREWLSQGHCLLVFPAGRVGLYRPEKGYVTDENWDEIALRLGTLTRAAFAPVFVEGESSVLFSVLSEYVYPMKLLFLVREFLRSFGKSIVFHVGRPISTESLASMDRRRANAWLRMRCYLLCPPGKGPMRRRRGASRGAGDRDAVSGGILHPEVEDYIRRYGLSEAELAELSVALAEGNAASCDAKVRELRRLGS